MFYPTDQTAMDLRLSATVKRICFSFTFSNNLFSRNGRMETMQAVIVSDNRRVTLDRFQAEIVLFDGSGGKSHDHCIVKCELILIAVKDECPVLLDPADGQVEQLLSDGLILPGSIAIYSCDVGLVPDRTRFRECTVNLTWSGVPPSCIQGKISWSILFLNSLNFVTVRCGGHS